ncbi:HAMP domain-containing sensor histidine kinase [Crocosphaera sp. XPORK-15E]|uniref:GAF domain-containing sensor histidine kinase n=1 Tax=Crocosphaera sp. XPORK-15E TaxID=3110247 RepID=UPI002B1F83C2|nr:HAMP domain-containing sensor histidine kinase [Crocosphaera sp. XPORK-15E]MEA5535327.1 HAMP domain-containing sensor histidine kinase [Crocosphaera sp. XPORK-15E]
MGQTRTKKLVGTLASQYSGIIKQQTKLSHQTGSYDGQKEFLRAIYHLLNSGINHQEIIAKILAIVGNKYSADNAILLRIESSICHIYQAWAATEKSLLERLVKNEWVKLFHCTAQHQVYQFCQAGAILGQSLDITPSKNIEEEGDFHYCILSVPIYLSKQLFGYLILATKEATRTFSLEEIETLEIVTDQIAIAIQNSQLQERLNQLELENKRLQSGHQNKSDYLSHMSHELRTPLAGILGFSKMLKEELYGPLNDKQKQYVNGIKVSGDHLLALVNDFLDLSKIEAEKEEIFLETVAVEDICLSAISMVQTKANEQKLNLIFDVADNIDFCTVDQRKIKQILLNLLSNAIKFTEKGSVTLQVKRTQNILIFCVIDTGIGLKEADQQKLFQPFQQIHNHLSRKHKGTGLGLALSRKLAQLHGGDLTLTSEFGQGSCFTLELPIQVDSSMS